MKAIVKKVIADGEWNDRPKFKVEMSDGHEYSTFSNLNNKLGEEIEFTYEENQYGRRMKVAREPFKPASTGSRPQSDPRTMLMAFSKDICVAMIEAKLLKDITEIQTVMLDTYKLQLKELGM